MKQFVEYEQVHSFLTDVTGLPTSRVVEIIRAEKPSEALDQIMKEAVTMTEHIKNAGGAASRAVSLRQSFILKYFAS